MKKILVTGGAGFIASHIVDKLIKNGDKVVVVDNLSTGREENLNKEAIFYNVDILDDSLRKVFEIEKPDCVIHHAAQIDVQRSIRQPMDDARVNVSGTINILECCKEYNVKKIVYASTAAVYGEPKYLGIDEKHPVAPISYYGISKHTPEHYIKVYSSLYGIKYTILRYANAYGIRQDPKGEGGVISIFVDKLLEEGTPIIFGTGEQTRDFIYVKDIVEANVLAVSKGDNNIFNIGTGVATSINELFNSMKEISGAKVEPIYKEARKGDILHSYFDISKAKEILGWSPRYSLKDGLKETICFYKEIFEHEILAASAREE